MRLRFLRFLRLNRASPLFRRRDKYVAVVGQVKSFGTELAVQAFDIRVVQDYNEVTHHCLEVVYSHLFLTKGPLDAPPPSTSAYGGKMVRCAVYSVRCAVCGVCDVNCTLCSAQCAVYSAQCLVFGVWCVV